jgi:lysozyme
MTRQISEDGLALVKRFEGLQLRAYKCPADVWTIGYGHTAGATQGLVIDDAEAHRLLRKDLANAEAAIDDMIRVALTDDQFAALVSWTFNVGAGAARASTLRRKLNAGDYDAVPTELAKWRKGGGKILNGLVRRRAAEAEIWSRSNIAPASPLPVPRPDNPDRSSPAKSKTIQAGAAGGGLLGVAIVDKLLDVDLDKAHGVLGALAAVDWQTVGVLAGAGVAVAFMMRERLTAWADGWR